MYSTGSAVERQKQETFEALTAKRLFREFDQFGFILDAGHVVGDNAGGPALCFRCSLGRSFRGIEDAPKQGNLTLRKDPSRPSLNPDHDPNPPSWSKPR
jgi:hypothetical protein